MAAVAAVRTAPGNKFFPVEMHESVSAFTGSDIDLCFINEHRYFPHSAGAYDCDSGLF